MTTYIGLDLGGTNIKISVFDDFFHKLGEKRTPTEVRFGSEHVLNRIYDAVLALLDELHLTCQDITCMGIGVPGILDIKNGISRFSEMGGGSDRRLDGKPSSYPDLYR